MNIAFCWDWEPSYEQTIQWEDGLCAALLELEKRGHQVARYIPTPEEVVVKRPDFSFYGSPNLKEAIKHARPDVILHWADCTRPNAQPLAELGIPMALCFAGGDPNGDTADFFDHFFVESQVYEDAFKTRSKSVSRAFGTNTELFKPIEQTKKFEVLSVGTFALWKRHQLFAESVKGLDALAVGYMYDTHEQECWQVCLDNGVAVLPHVSARALHRLYAMSEICVVTASSVGGSQRTVLEAMAMNMPLIVTDSDKFDFIRNVFECEPNPHEIRGCIDAILDGDHEMNTRQYVLDNWSEYTYADSLEKGLKALI